MTIAGKFSQRLLESNGMSVFRVAWFIWIAFTFTTMARAGGVVSTCDEAHVLAAVSGGGTVTFTCSGTISFSNTVSINDDTTIDGSGQSVTFRDGGSFGLLFVGNLSLDQPPALSVYNLTLANATNSAIYNGAAVVFVANTTFIGNSSGSNTAGGAIYNSQGLAIVHDSRFLLNYGGIAGGAIYNDPQSSLYVLDSVFTLNRADLQGGAIYNDGGSMNIANSTFAENGSDTAVGGNVMNDTPGTAELRNSTLVGGRAAPGRAGDLYATALGSTTVTNTIMANPGSPLVTGVGNCEGKISDGGGNLQWPPGNPHPCVGKVADPKLGLLQNNGGFTETMALAPGSAAIDTGKDVFCTLEDQRHVLRPQGPHCDIGAFEVSTANHLGQSVGQILIQLLPNLSRSGMNKLTEQVIDPLSRSLDSSLWQGNDGNHLNPQHGTRVFDLQETVVSNLADLIVNQAQLDYIKNLVLANRTLAVVAISDANCSVNGTTAPTDGNCGRAASELAKGDSSSAAGNYSDAIDHYKNAWSALIQPA